jgi:IS30 family transposase
MTDLDRLAASRRRADERARSAYDALLTEVIRLLRETDGGNVRELARRAGIAHGTIYNELERRRRAQDDAA